MKKIIVFVAPAGSGKSLFLSALHKSGIKISVFNASVYRKSFIPLESRPQITVFDECTDDDWARIYALNIRGFATHMEIIHPQIICLCQSKPELGEKAEKDFLFYHLSLFQPSTLMDKLIEGLAPTLPIGIGLLAKSFNESKTEKERTRDMIAWDYYNRKMASTIPQAYEMADDFLDAGRKHGLTINLEKYRSGYFEYEDYINSMELKEDFLQWKEEKNDTEL